MFRKTSTIWLYMKHTWHFQRIRYNLGSHSFFILSYSTIKTIQLDIYKWRISQTLLCNLFMKSASHTQSPLTYCGTKVTLILATLEVLCFILSTIKTLKHCRLLSASSVSISVASFKHCHFLCPSSHTLKAKNLSIFNLTAPVTSQYF